MHLPYPVNPPTWTSHGFHSLNTRPFLALHRDKYTSIHRLFPASSHAQQLRPPIFPHPSDIPTPQTEPTSPAQYHEDDHQLDTPLFHDDEVLDNSDEDESFHQFSTSQSRKVQNHSWRTGVSRPSQPPLSVSGTIIETEALKQDHHPPPPSQAFDDDPLPLFASSVGNALASVKICNENALVCSLSGQLDALSVYEINTSPGHDGNMVQTLVNRNGSPSYEEYTPADNFPINNLVTSNSEHQCGDPAKLAAITRTSISFATISADKLGPSISWVDNKSFPCITSCAFNPLYAEEVAVLSDDGLYFNPMSRFQCHPSSHISRYDIQVISPQKRFRSLFYDTHPRTLLLSSRKEIVRHDLRQKWINKTVIFNTHEDWNLPRYDSNIAAIHPVQTRGFQMLLATQSKLNYIDLRMPQSPLLDWSLTIPLPVDQMCVANLAPSHQPKSDVIALVSRKQHYLELFHGLHVDGAEPRTEVEPGQDIPRFPASTIAKPAVLWSDLPWSHLTKLKPAAKIAGIALLPQNDSSAISLVQWSLMDGLVSHLLNVQVSHKDVCIREDNRESITSPIDDVTNLINCRTALVESGDLAKPENISRPVTGSDPGSILHSKMLRLFSQDAYSLRERICISKEDDVSDDKKFRLSRVFMGDIPNIRRLRAGTLRSSTGRGVQTPNSKKRKRTDDLDESNDRTLTPSSGEKDCDVGSNELDLEEHSGDECVGMSSLMDELQVPKTLDEMARLVRSGMPHNPTPLGYSGLLDTIESSPFVESYDAEWHSACKHPHENYPNAVSTNEPLPSWVSTSMFVANHRSRGEAILNSEIPESSGHGQLLSRMKYEFFHEEVPENMQQSNSNQRMGSAGTEKMSFELASQGLLSSPIDE